MAAKDLRAGKKDEAPDPEDIKTELLMREVEEEVRREQIAKLWKAYGTYVIAGAITIVVGVGGWQWSKQRAIETAEAAGAEFTGTLALVEAGKSDETIKALSEIAKKSSSGYGALARMRLASEHAKAGRTAPAVEAFDALGKDGGADPLLRDLAQMQAAALRLGEADWTEMQNRLNGLVGEKSTYRASARELLGLAAIKAGRTDEARKTFQELLADRKVPPSIGQRVQILMGQLVAAELASSPPASGGSSGAAPKKP